MPNVFRLFFCLFDLGDVFVNNVHATARSLGSTWLLCYWGHVDPVEPADEYWDNYKHESEEMA
jgi:hypothetical protein